MYMQVRLLNPARETTGDEPSVQRLVHLLSLSRPSQLQAPHQRPEPRTFSGFAPTLRTCVDSVLLGDEDYYAGRSYD